MCPQAADTFSTELNPEYSGSALGCIVNQTWAYSPPQDWLSKKKLVDDESLIVNVVISPAHLAPHHCFFIQPSQCPPTPTSQKSLWQVWPVKKTSATSACGASTWPNRIPTIARCPTRSWCCYRLKVFRSHGEESHVDQGFESGNTRRSDYKGEGTYCRLGAALPPVT